MRFLSFFFLVFSLKLNAQNLKYSKDKLDFEKINDSLYMDKYEVSNKLYRDYQTWLKKVAAEDYLKSIPDTNVWNINNRPNGPYENYYYRHPTFDNYPVVGISYEQAKSYCEWKTNMLKEFFRKFSKANPFENKSIHFSLPTEREWELSAENIDTFSSIKKVNKIFKKNDKYYLANVLKGEFPVELGGSKTYTSAVDSYLKNKNGLYNMIGNVSEMTSTKGISKGGNFLLPLSYST